MIRCKKVGSTNPFLYDKVIDGVAISFVNLSCPEEAIFEDGVYQVLMKF